MKSVCGAPPDFRFPPDLTNLASCLVAPNFSLISEKILILPPDLCYHLLSSHRLHGISTTCPHQVRSQGSCDQLRFSGWNPSRSDGSNSEATGIPIHRIQRLPLIPMIGACRRMVTRRNLRRNSFKQVSIATLLLSYQELALSIAVSLKDIQLEPPQRYTPGAASLILCLLKLF